MPDAQGRASVPASRVGHLAELTGDRARILACDLTEAKEEKIRENIVRMGYRSIATVVADAAEVSFPEKFDRVLIDAPCSNSGVLARRVEARHRIEPGSLGELGKLQRSILDNAAANLKPGGCIVYSVCSVLLEEGVDVVHRFVGDASKWDVEEEKFILPVPGWHDGGYVCRLQSR
jgi:16S rRNA (cytosine967-C5)-methyltransferase